MITTPAYLSKTHTLQTLVGVGMLLLGLGLAVGAFSIPLAEGYGGVGPSFLPWLVAVALTVCGGFIIRESRSGGFRALDDVDGSSPACWAGFIWVSAGLLANAALITSIGFILSCTLCFMLAVHGLRHASGRTDHRQATWVKDAFIGVAIAAPVYWAFIKFLAINLPGLTKTGWL